MKRGLSVVSLDWRGQGLSDRLVEPRLKGHVGDFAEFQRDLDTLLTGEISGSGRAASDDSLATDRWREEGPWLLLLLLPIAALAFRRGWVLVLLIFVAPIPQPVHASEWDNLWLTPDQQGQRELDAGNDADAAALFDDPDWQGVASYRAGNYADSAAVFAEAGDARGFYNLGNALVMQGDFDGAIGAYEKSLELNPDNEDAKYNLEIAEDLKEQQEQEQQEGQGDDQQGSENPGGQGEQSDSEGEQQQGSEGQQSEGDSQEGDPSDRGDEQMSEEDMQALQEELDRAAEEAQQGNQSQMSEAELAAMRQQQEQEQAMEQWLRRIPDDPGGLLRRKFRYQYQRQGKDQDGNNVWPDNEVQPW